MPIEYPPEILGEMLEAQEFMKKHGKVGIGERREVLIKSGTLSEEEQKRLTSFENQYEHFIKELKAAPEVKRLKGLRELAGTANVYDKPQPGGGARVSLPAFHTRFDHGELCAEQVKFAGIKLGLSDEEILISFSAAMLHDIGHPTLCHIGDYFLEKKGRGNHEERGIAIIQNKKSSINQLLEKNNIDPERVAQTIAEKGYLGTMQSLFDTLSYLTVDSEMIRKPLYQDNGAGLIQNLAGIDKDKGLLKVEKVELWQDLLEKRAEMMRDVYLHPAHRRQRAAMRQLLQVAINKGHLTLDNIERGVDKDIEMRLQSLVQHDRGAAIFGGREDATPYLREYLELWGLANGEYDPELWQRMMFENQEKMNAFLYEKLKPEALEQTVIVTPFDYTKKKLVVVDDERGEEIILKSQNVELRDWDTMHIAYIPKFIK
jgi:hypothetical protein